MPNSLTDALPDQHAHHSSIFRVIGLDRKRISLQTVGEWTFCENTQNDCKKNPTLQCSVRLFIGFKRPMRLGLSRRCNPLRLFSHHQVEWARSTCFRKV